MTEYCAVCKKDKEHTEWRNVSVGRSVRKWICGDHFKQVFIEVTTESIKQGRREYWNSIVQPIRDDKLSKEYVEAYPEKAAERYTPEEIKKAKILWNDLPDHEYRHQSK